VADIEFESLPPLLRCWAEESASPGIRTCVDDEQVHSTKCSGGFVDEALDLALAPHVRNDATDCDATVAQFLYSPIQVIAPSTTNPDRTALSG
jgi:hypothetical protein